MSFISSTYVMNVESDSLSTNVSVTCESRLSESHFKSIILLFIKSNNITVYSCINYFYICKLPLVE